MGRTLSYLRPNAGRDRDRRLPNQNRRHEQKTGACHRGSSLIFDATVHGTSIPTLKSLLPVTPLFHRYTYKKMASANDTVFCRTLSRRLPFALSGSRLASATPLLRLICDPLGLLPNQPSIYTGTAFHTEPRKTGGHWGTTRQGQGPRRGGLKSFSLESEPQP